MTIPNRNMDNELKQNPKRNQHSENINHVKFSTAIEVNKATNKKISTTNLDPRDNRFNN